MKYLRQVWRNLCRWWSSLWDPPYRAVNVEELPDTLEKKILYIAGECEHLWFVAMICPCGCGQVLQMNLLKQTRPCWTVTVDSKGIPSLSPSVWRQVGCRSHFFLTRGRIQWSEGFRR